MVNLTQAHAPIRLTHVLCVRFMLLATQLMSCSRAYTLICEHGEHM